MKIFSFLIFAIICSPLFAAELWHIDFPDAKSIEAFPIWQSKSKVVRSYASGIVPDSKLKGSVRFVVEKGGNHGSDSTPVFSAPVKIVSGQKYQLQLQLMSPQKLDFSVVAMLDAAPWAKLGKDSSRRVVTSADQWQTVTIDFVADRDANRVRIPAFFLGNLKAGDTLYVAEGRFSGPDKVTHNLFSVTDEPRMTNIPQKRNWSYKAAWKQKNGKREKISLCGLWDFAPAAKANSPQPAADSPEWGHMLVPAHWRGGNVTNFIHTRDGKAVTAFKGIPVKELRDGWYKRTIDVPEEWRGRKVLLHFNRIDTAGDVFVNGKRMGGSENFSTIRECSFDVSDALHYGKVNEISVRVGTPGNLREERSGIAGYVYLMTLPKENFGDPAVSTAVSAKQLKIDFRKPTVQNGSLKLAIRDWKTGEKVFETSRDFAPSMKIDYLTPKLWSPESPNLYWLDLELVRNGNVIDAKSVRFGSSELQVKGADYYLNGKKINLFADTGVDGGTYWSIDWKNSGEYVRRELKSLRAMNINAVYFGGFMPKELLDIYDEEGILVLAAAGISYDDHMKNDDAAVMKIFEKKVADLRSSDRFDNHPSHVGFQIDVWYNFHPGTTNPEYVGLKNGTPSYPAFDRAGNIITKTTGDPNLDGERGKRKTRLDAIASLFKQNFPGKLMLTGGSGEVGDVYATHGYHTWGAPFEEMRAFFRRYGLQRERPIFVGEHNIPYPGSLYSIFNFTAGGADPLSMENFARYAGNDGYRWRAFYGRRALHDMGPESIQDSRTDRDSEGIYYICSDLYSALLSRALETMIPGWRNSGANGIGFFCYVLGQHFSLAGQAVPRYRSVSDELSTPAFHPEYLPGGANPSAVSVYEAPFFLKPTLSSPAFLRVSAPILVEFLEDSADEYAQDHAYFGGELLRKKLLIINDSNLDREFNCRVTLRNERNGVLASENFKVSLKQGARTTLPVKFELPQLANRLNGFLRAEVVDAGGTVSACLPVELFPHPAPLATAGKLYLCDPEGSVKKYLQQQNVRFEELKSLDQLPKKGVLIVGRKALALTPTVPDFNTLAAGGLNSLILEQPISTSSELMVTRTRHAFLNAAGHPALKGFEDRDFANWRGNVSLADAYDVNPPGHGWSAAGNRNMVASYVFRRPSHGNYLTLLGSGFDLYQTPLLEYRSSGGSWIGSQLELAPRLGGDPVATTLFHRLVSYLDQRGVDEGKTLFFGGAAGKKLLKRLKVQYEPVSRLDAKTLAGAGTLLISDPDFKVLKGAAMDLAAFVYNGGKILYLQTGKTFESVWLPFPLKLESAKSRLALHNVGKVDDFWRCGWDNNDLYWHEMFDVPVFTGVPEQANAFNPGVAVDLPYGAGRFTLVSIEPGVFDNATATGKTCRFLSALLTNAGVAIRNASTAYLPKKGSEDCSLDLATYNWSFALDPDNKGLAEKVETGKKGSLFWQTGLIADGAEVKIGVAFEHFLRRDYDGYVWYRLELDLPEALLKAEKLYLSFGAIDDFDETFFNGVKIGSTGREISAWWESPRLYTIPGKLLKPGKNLLVIRVFDEKGEGGITRLPAVLSNRPAGSGERGWKTPYQEGTRRDYDYKPDPVRQY